MKDPRHKAPTRAELVKQHNLTLVPLRQKVESEAFAGEYAALRDAFIDSAMHYEDTERLQAATRTMRSFAVRLADPGADIQPIVNALLELIQGELAHAAGEGPSRYLHENVWRLGTALDVELMSAALAPSQVWVNVTDMQSDDDLPELWRHIVDARQSLGLEFRPPGRPTGSANVKRKQVVAQIASELDIDSAKDAWFRARELADRWWPEVGLPGYRGEWREARRRNANNLYREILALRDVGKSGP